MPRNNFSASLSGASAGDRSAAACNPRARMTVYFMIASLSAGARGAARTGQAVRTRLGSVRSYPFSAISMRREI
jgi:hypothetical protein